MNSYKSLIIILCFATVIFSSSQVYSQTCPNPARVLEDGSDHDTIQIAYDYASVDLGLTDFTLKLAAETIFEDLILDGGSVTLDGGYDCSFSSKTTTTEILGSITISTGSATLADIRIISPAQCAFDSDGDGFTAIGSCEGSADDCDDNNANTYPGAPEICDGADNNCNGQTDEGLFVVDADGDGYTAEGSCGGSADDCNDTDPNINPGITEILGDGIDQDCDGHDLINSSEINCISCHGGSVWFNANIHQSVAPPDNTCLSCHAAKVNGVLTGHYGETVRTNGNNMTAGQVIVCTSCHDYHDAALYDVGNANVVWPNVKATYNIVTEAYENLTCDTCHAGRAEAHDASAHTIELGSGDLSGGVSCGACHAVASWIEIEGVVHNVATNGDGSCATCHNSPRQEVQITIANGANPTNCLNCHSDKAVSHGNIDHVTPGYVTGGTTLCMNCHDTGGAANGTVSVIHNNTCSHCHTTAPFLKPGVPAGGDCVTCHGDYFPNHTHHDTANNGVSYNAATDTSQSSRVGCAVCHHDYDNIHGTSVGLDDWATILIEHDIDGTKDGSDNTCDNCHAYAGDSSAPLVAVQNAIASGNPATCATCHTDKVPDVDHGVPVSGKHTEHLAITGVSCSTCHGNVPYFKSGTDSNGDGLFTLDETDVCDACHQDGAGNPATGIKDGWTTAGSGLDCSSCHAAAPATGSHDIHLFYTSCTGCHDGAVANTTAPEQHLDNNVDVYDAVAGDLGYPVDKTIGSAVGSCTSSYCHSSVQGVTDPTDPPIYAASPDWGTSFGSTAATCTGCHDSGGHVGDAGSPLTTGSHARHLDFRYDQDATCNACHFDWSYTGCSTCHQRQVKHVDNNIDVVFKPDFPLTASSSSGAYSGNPAPRTPYGSCSALYCHSPGSKASAPYDDPNVTNISWGGSSMPADCTGCHDGDAAAAQAMVTGSHGIHVASYDCSTCHARTVDDSRTLNSTVYATKNYTYGQRYHVDGWITVAFSSDAATNGTYDGAASPVLYRAPGSSPGACASTYCHNIGTPQWGGSVACGDCHAVNSTLAGMHASHYNSTDDATDMQAANNSTPDNYIFTCGVCHDTAHPNYKGHVTGPVNADPTHNQVAEVYFDTTVAGGPIGGIGWITGATAGTDPVGFPWTDQECGNMYCHSPGNKNAAPYDGAPATPNWVTGFSGECRECHYGDALASTTMASGSHFRHVYADVAYQPVKNLTNCIRCHDATMDSYVFNGRLTSDNRTIKDKSKHVNRQVNIAFDATADPAGTGSYAGAQAGPISKVPGTAYGDCSNTYCHSQGTSVVAPYPAPNFPGPLTWGMEVDNFRHPDSPDTGQLLSDHCSACHGGYDDVWFGGIDTNAHQAHIAFANEDKIGDTIGCSNCHRALTAGGMRLDTPENHIDGFVEIKFKKDPLEAGINFDTDGPAGTGPTYAGQNTAGDDPLHDFAQVVPDTSTKYTCSNVYCHSNGNLAANVNDIYWYPDEQWGEGALADPATAFKTIEWNSTTHISCDGCHGDGAGRAHPTYANGGAGTTTANSHEAHVVGAGLNCTYCHVETLSDTNIPPSGGLITYRHINRLEDVSLKPMVERIPDAYEAEGPKTCSAVYCHGDGTELATGIVDTSQLLVWGGASMTCNSCHNTTDATNNLGPDYPSGSPKANSHAAHQAYGCNACHYNTTADGTTITNPAAHVNEQYDIEAGSSITFNYFYNTNGSTCTNISCHGGSGAVWGASPDHAGIIMVGSTACADCHSNPPPLIDGGDPQVHNSCASCHDVNGTLIGSATGKSAPGDCTTCHGADIQEVHTSCTTCHGEPPDGTSAPNTEGAHTDHAALGYGSVNPSCSACHNNAMHYDGNTDVSLSSSFTAQSGTFSYNSSSMTCSSTRCHGGQTTPNWSSGSIDVNTQCTSCHARRTSMNQQYNSYYSGEHSKHVNSERIPCYDCHSTSKLATGHFTNLQTSTFEQDPAATIGGSGTRVGSYNGSTCSNIQCHGSENW